MIKVVDVSVIEIASIHEKKSLQYFSDVSSILLFRE
jgi:hypothetical protein